jgi:hypothetical protein
MTLVREKRNPTSAAKRSDDYIRRRERLLDEALTNTFPASDPPAIAMP